MHSPLALLFLLPAGICGCAFLYYLCESAQERHLNAGRLSPDHRAWAHHFLMATLCLAGLIVASVPVILFATDVAMLRGVAQ